MRLLICGGRNYRDGAFPGGPGTADMVKQAKAAGIPTTEVEE